MPFVLDCSMTMAWVFSDEATAKTDTLLLSLENDTAVVPALWRMEVANVLLAATRRGRIRKDEWGELLDNLTALPVEIDDAGHRVFEDALPLADSFGLTVYDAVYLELAIRRNLSLATLDKGLIRACADAGVEVV